MSKIEMTPALAMAAGYDAANRRMRKEGRTTWSEDDWNHAVEIYEACMGTIREGEKRIAFNSGRAGLAVEKRSELLYLEGIPLYDSYEQFSSTGGEKTCSKSCSNAND